MKTIKINDFKKLVENNEIQLLIDVRSPAEYEAVHVNGAINIPLGELTTEKLLELNKSSPDIYFICQSGGRSSKACEKFANFTQFNVISVEQGTKGAQEAGISIISSSRKVISLERQVRIAAGFLVATSTIFGALVNINFLFISGFVGIGLMFAGITDWCGMALLLAKCPWNQSKSCKKNLVNCCQK